MPWSAEKLAQKRANSARAAGHPSTTGGRPSGRQRAEQLKRARAQARMKAAPSSKDDSEERSTVDPNTALDRIAQWRAAHMPDTFSSEQQHSATVDSASMVRQTVSSCSAIASSADSESRMPWAQVESESITARAANMSFLEDGPGLASELMCAIDGQGGVPDPVQSA